MRFPRALVSSLVVVAGMFGATVLSDETMTLGLFLYSFPQFMHLIPITGYLSGTLFTVLFTLGLVLLVGIVLAVVRFAIRLIWKDQRAAATKPVVIFGAISAIAALGLTRAMAILPGMICIAAQGIVLALTLVLTMLVGHKPQRIRAAPNVLVGATGAVAALSVALASGFMGIVTCPEMDDQNPACVLPGGLGFLIGGLAILALTAMIIRWIPRTKQGSGDKTIICPACGSFNDVGVTACPMCQTSLTDTGASLEVMQPATETPY